MTGRSRDQSMVSSVRFENDDDDARSVMDGFQHRCGWMFSTGAGEILLGLVR